MTALSREEVLAGVTAEIAQMGADVDLVDSEGLARLREDLGLDDLDVVEALIGVEERFGVELELSDEEAEVRTVGDVVRFVESAIGGSL